MTIKDIEQKFGIRVRYFDGNLIPDEPGFFNKELGVAFISNQLNEKDKIKVLLHEVGHMEHTSYQYELFRTKCELQADKNMIFHLVEETLKTLDDVTEFNYLNFMKYYNLSTITDEVVVREAYHSLVG